MIGMEETLSTDLIYIFAYFLGGMAFAVGPFVIVHLLAARGTRNYANKTDQFIECGMDPIGDAWIRYSAVYYLYALVFVIFDIETIFIYPWAVAFKRLGLFAFVEMAIFIAILAFGLIYAWKKKMLEWD